MITTSGTYKLSQIFTNVSLGVDFSSELPEGPQAVSKGILRTSADLEISIPAGLTVTLHDDLSSNGMTDASICIIAHENAEVSYEFRATDGAGSDTLTKRSITVVLAGAGARVFVKCLCFGRDEQQFVFTTLQDHQVGHATSNVVVKSVLDGRAKLTCSSMINVSKQGGGTHAEQVNKNILLSRQARAVSVPMLEVLANDVTCKHGAAVSQIDAEQMFYLQSRGMDGQRAKQVLLDAFLS